MAREPKGKVHTMNGLCPVEIKFENLDYLKKLISKSRGAVVIAERSTSDLWGLTPTIESAGVIWIDSIPSNPTQREVVNALKAVGDAEPNHIIAVGGGSSLDLAKALSAFRYMFEGGKATIEDITKAITSKSYTAEHRMIDIIAVPSTSGTGSEVTKWATIWDVDKVSKFSIECSSLYARQALIIPELTASMPASLTLATALDALCHASEAFWAKQTTPLVKEIACRAVDIIMTNLGPALRSPADIRLRRKLAAGSVLAGIAFSQTHTTACHSISYPITMKYNVPHGYACAITLDPVSKLNRPATEDADMLFECYERHGGLKNWLDDVSFGIVTLRLSAFGVKRNELQDIVKSTFTKGRMDNNPVDLGETDVLDILCSVF
jgi:alcohol dehydrogenase class IV